MKRVLILLLAVLMIVTLAACTKKGDQKDDKPADDQPADTTPVEDASYVPVDEVVYTAGANVQLFRDLATQEGAVTIEKAATELQRIKVSTKLQTSVVKYKGENYYVASGFLTAADIYGKNFTPADKTMYATTDLNVRSCADVTLSEVVGHLSKNDEVKVIGEGNGWSKISYTKDGVTGEYFVGSSYLSVELEVDYSKEDYTAYFTPCNEEHTVLAVNLNFRIAPIVKETTLAPIKSLEKGEKVTLVGYGKGEYACWGMVLRAEKPGATPKPFYVKLCADDCSDVYIVIPEAALKNQIAKLGFTAKSETLVAPVNFEIRPAPSVNTEPRLTAFGKKGDTVEVVAVGSVTEQDTTNEWLMVKIDSLYRYVEKAFFNGKKDGAGAMTLEQLLAKYKNLSQVEEATVTVTAADGAICYYDLDRTESGITLKKGDEVTLVAKSTPVNAGDVVWYVFRTEGNAYYCAGSTQFN